MTPAAYYNEIDPFAAQWLRNLIAGGHIAPGEVDERSIEDVTPDDLRGFTQCHFFAGIGGSGRWKDGISWDALQEIKSAVGYGDRDAVEIFPAQKDLVNVANMRHLWIVPESIPFAWRRNGH